MNTVVEDLVFCPVCNAMYEGMYVCIFIVYVGELNKNSTKIITIDLNHSSLNIFTVYWRYCRVDLVYVC